MSVGVGGGGGGGGSAWKERKSRHNHTQMHTSSNTKGVESAKTRERCAVCECTGGVVDEAAVRVRCVRVVCVRDVACVRTWTVIFCDDALFEEHVLWIHALHHDISIRTCTECVHMQIILVLECHEKMLQTRTNTTNKRHQEKESMKDNRLMLA
jgi:hypothetical protein